MAVVGMTPEPNGMVVFVPTSDPKNVLAKLKAQPDGNFHRFSVGDKPVYANVRRNWLVTAFDPEALRTLNAVDKTVESNWSAARKQLMASSDVFVYFGVQRWRPVIEKGLDEVLEQLKETPLPENATMPGVDVMEFVQWEFQAVRSLVEQTESVYGGISIDPSRVRSRFYAAFGPGSYLHTLAKSQPTPRPNLLDNLPNRPFMMAMGLDSQSLKQFLVDMVKSMTELPKFGKFVRDKEFKEALEQSLAFYKELNGFNMTFNFGPAGMESAGHYFYDDPSAARKQIHAAMGMSRAMWKSMGLEGMRLEARTKKVGELEVDEFTMEFKEVENELANAMRAIYGEKLRMQFASMDESLAFAMGSQRNPIRVFTSPRRELTAANRVRLVLEDLPGRPVGVALIDPSNFVHLIKRTAGAPNSGVNENEKEIAVADRNEIVPPIGLALTANESGYVCHFVVRAETVKALIQAGERLPKAGSQRKP
jgi:hypothetical protein